MIIKKITTGFVIQSFDTDSQRWTSQEFVAGDQCEYETDDGEPVDETEFDNLVVGKEEPYLRFDMIQPD